MKRKAVLVCAVVSVLLISWSASLTLTHQLTLEQDTAISTEAREANSSPSLGEAEHSAEKTSSGKTEDCAINGDSAHSTDVSTEGVSKAIESSLQDDRVDTGLENDIQPSKVPIPNGRIFYRGEPHYGYLPTCYPKKNISLPIIPLEFD